VTGRLVLTALGALIFGYGLWALYSGRVLITWGRFADRPDAIYWITVACLLLLGGANVMAGLRQLFR
jgi:hypothetical protein